MPEIKESSPEPNNTNPKKDAKNMERKEGSQDPKQTKKVNDLKKTQSSLDPKMKKKVDETKKSEVKETSPDPKDIKKNLKPAIEDISNKTKTIINKVNDTGKKDKNKEAIAENLADQNQGKLKITNEVRPKIEKNNKELVEQNQTKNNLNNPNIQEKNDLNDQEKKQSESKSVFSTKTVKESEQNPFKTLLDITDLIETEPELERGLKDVENILLRYLSDMKIWYRFYTNKDSNSNETDNSNIKEKEAINNKNANQVNDKSLNESVLDNNDIGFAMEMKDIWRFIRDSNILSLEFSLASFNRIYFRGPKNYIEMYLCPDEIKLYSKEYYDYIYTMTQKSKDDFMFKYRDKFHNSSTNLQNQAQDFSNLLFKPSEIENNVDIHYKKNIVLLRHFFESIVRIAYLKYFQSSEPLHKKIKNLIEHCIKTNPNLNKTGKKSNTHDSSLNSTLILDMKAKTFEPTFENFIRENDIKLKKIFANLFSKSPNSFKKSDTTITYRFFYEMVIKRSTFFNDLFDKFKFVELMTVYLKDKLKITEENMHSNQITSYIDTLFDCEIIFYEFCELVFFCFRKYSTENSISEKKEKDTFIELLNHFLFLSSNSESIYTLSERYVYHFPKLANHRRYEAIIEADKQRRMLEERKRMEIKRLEFERNMISLEDINILRHEEIETLDDGMSDNSNEGD